MPPTPSRAGAADGDAPAAVTRGASALRDFLARDSHARGSRADPRAFADWLEDETFARIRSDEAFALRAYANGLRRRHAALLDPLLAAVADAEAAYDASDDAARIRAAATDVERANAAVAGIRRFLDDPPRAEAEATTKNDAKRLATRAKLDAFLARLPIAERHLNDVRASSELHRARADARAALAEAREAVGLADAEAAAAEASRIFGGDVVDKGESFETTCEAIVRDFLHRDPNAFRSSTGSLDGDRALDREEGDLWLLRNVTLGMAAGEIDLAVVRARRDDPSAFVDAIPRDGDGVRRRAGNDTTAESARGASGPDSESAPAVDVLAIVECKRNPDDVVRGFHARQTTLGWLAGSDYDPEDWRNTRHPTGHFVRGYHPVRLATRVAVPGKDAAAARESGGKDAESAFALTPQSFRRFRKSDANEGGFFLRGLWFITRARTMTGMDAKVRGTKKRFGAIRSRSASALAPVWRARDFFLRNSHPGRTYLGRGSEGPPGSSDDDRALHSAAQIERGYACDELARVQTSRVLLFRDPHLRRSAHPRLRPTKRPHAASTTPLSLTHRPPRLVQIRAPLLEMAASRVAARLFETLGEVPTRDAFVASAETWRDERRARGTECGASETNDPLRRDLERVREWAARAGEDVPHPSDTRGVLETYLEAEGDAVPGQIVLVRASRA